MKLKNFNKISIVSMNTASILSNDYFNNIFPIQKKSRLYIDNEIDSGYALCIPKNHKKESFLIDMNLNIQSEEKKRKSISHFRTIDAVV